jgi:oxygen-dependent protoporphyrinogen oxidase
MTSTLSRAVVSSSAAPVAGGEDRDVVVVGAGVSGLAAALALAAGGARVTVLEAADRPGGSLRSLQSDGFTFELGPNTVLERPPVTRLLTLAGLAAERLKAAPVKRRYLWREGRLAPVPRGPLGFLGSPLLPPGAKLALLREPFVGRGPAARVAASDDAADEPIAAFVRRRLGEAWLRYGVGPFLAGVYAGDPERLSLAWAAPRVAGMERAHGSLLRAMFAARRQGGLQPPSMIGWPGGFEELARRLAAKLPDVRLASAATALRRDDGGWRVTTPRGELTAPALVVALPAEPTAALLAGASEGRSAPLADVPYAPVAVCCLGYRREQVAHPLDGFGFLAPRGEGLRLLGCLFSSTMFPGRAPAGHVALNAFAGGRLDPELMALTDAEVLAVVDADLRGALGLRGEPVFRHVHRWPRAIPQYELGHGRFVRLAAALEEALRGVHLAGSWSGGVSVPDSIARGFAVADRVLSSLGRLASASP